MNYLICQEFKNTSNNHAGMKHMCMLLKNKYPEEYKVTVFPYRQRKDINGLSFYDKLYGKVISLHNKYFVVLRRNLFHAILLILKVKRNDRIILLEYIFPVFNQKIIAVTLKFFRPNVTIIGLAHLTPSYLSNMITEKEIVKWSHPVGYIMTLGTSLTDYLNKCGIPENKLLTTFHYVDVEYYKPDIPITLHDPVTIICMGGLQRNFELLSAITKKIESANWIICKGNNDVDYLFADQSNVKLVNYVDEDTLKDLMASADISLNVMDDTVGSNVITTSMAMGLIMVVSDVGSIKDYCDDEFSIYCENSIDNFVSGISNLLSKKSDMISMKNKSLKRSTNLSIEKFHNIIQQIQEL